MIILNSSSFMIKRKPVPDINFVFTEGIGKAFVKKVTVSEVIDFYKRYRDKH